MRSTSNAQTLRALVFEDNEDDVELLRLELRRSGFDAQIQHTTSPADLRRALERTWDVILSDFQLRGSTAMDALAIVRRERDLDTPFIVVSGSIGEDIAVETMRAGADDYFRKEHLERLGPAIRRCIREAAHRRELKEAREHALHQRLQAQEDERRRLLGLLEQVPAMVNFLRGPNLVFEFAHPATRAALNGRELVGCSLVHDVPELTGAHFVECIREVYRTGRAHSQEEAVAPLAIDRLGHERFWSSVYLPVRDNAGAVEGVLTFDMDVTAFVLARRELERANRAKDEFLAIVSHELRTPLNAILGWTMNLRRAAPPAAIDKPLAVIERNAKAQARLIEDVLDMARLTAGKLQLEMATLDVRGVINAAVDALGPEATAKGISVAVDVDDDIGLRADGARLQQVILNLLANAVKFTPEGGAVEVTARRVGSSEFQITVRDNGDGIPPELLTAIFEPFRQIDSSTTRSHGGLGLGLTLVQRVVQAHGGTVRASSDGVGRGSCFTVTLPYAAEPSARHADTKVPETNATRLPRIDGVRVLLVDDHADCLSSMADALRGHGAAVECAGSADEALQKLAHFNPAVLVSDIGMPLVDGYELLKRIRALPPSAGGAIPALALTAFARSEDAVRAAACGFQGHVPKPVDPAELVMRVADLVRTPDTETE